MARVSARIIWCLGTALVMVTIIALAAVGVLIWKFVSEDAACQDEEEDLQKLFPGYFRTSSEQVRFIDRYPRAIQTPRTVKPYKCSFGCPPLGEEDIPFSRFIPQTTTPSKVSLGRKKRADSAWHNFQSDDVEKRVPTRLRFKRAPGDDATILSGPVYHACCASWRVESQLETAMTSEGFEVEVVQTRLFKQYFEEEYCEHYDTCYADGCTCDTTKYVTHAVVYKDKNANKIKDRYDVAPIVLDGCCKCLNLL